jgi:hypothetical protein
MRRLLVPFSAGRRDFGALILRRDGGRKSLGSFDHGKPAGEIMKYEL